jgi:hypothetical protein
MLLSLYVSFRLSSIFEHERVSYVLLMAGFIVVASFLSTFVSVLWLWLLVLYPFWLVSFPFSSTAIRTSVNGGRMNVTGYNINFLGIQIASISPQSISVYGFSFFLLVNLIGAMLGYWINKKLLEESFSWKLFNFLFRSGILFFIVCYGILWLTMIALSLMMYYGAGDISFMIVENVLFFSRYLFWVPATIATAIYGIYKWSKVRKRYSVIG